MKRFFGALAVSGITVGFLCLAAGEALATNPERPFRGRFEATRVSVGQCDPGTVGIFPPELWEGTSIVTHEGRGEASLCTVQTHPVGPFAAAAEGRGVATAANGDQVYFTLAGITDASSDPCVGDYTITADGGTGRFEDASGSIHAAVIIPWSAPFTCGPEQSARLSGTIKY